MKSSALEVQRIERTCELSRKHITVERKLQSNKVYNVYFYLALLNNSFYGRECYKTERHPIVSRFFMKH